MVVPRSTNVSRSTVRGAATDALNTSPARTLAVESEFSSCTVNSVPAGRMRRCDPAWKGKLAGCFGSGAAAGNLASAAKDPAVTCLERGGFAPYVLDSMLLCRCGEQGDPKVQATRA